MITTIIILLKVNIIEMINRLPDEHLVFILSGAILMLIVLIICATIIGITITKAVMQYKQHNAKINDAKMYCRLCLKSVAKRKN